MVHIAAPLGFTQSVTAYCLHGSRSYDTISMVWVIFVGFLHCYIDPYGELEAE